MKRTLDRLPAEWGRKEYERCLTHLFRSKNAKYLLKPSKVLLDLRHYLETPLNGYDRPLQRKEMDLQEQLAENDEYFERERERKAELERYPEPEEPEAVKELCAALHKIVAAKQVNGMVDRLSGCQRQAMAQLLKDWTAEAIVRAFREFITQIAPFDVHRAAVGFVSNAAAMLVTVAEQDRQAAARAAALAAERRAAAERVREYTERVRREEIVRGILIDEELIELEQWDGASALQLVPKEHGFNAYRFADKYWAQGHPVRDRALMRECANGQAEREALWKLENQIAAAPDFQPTLAARLAETTEVQQERERQRVARQRAQRQRRYEWKDQQREEADRRRVEEFKQRKREIKEWAKRESQAAGQKKRASGAAA